MNMKQIAEEARKSLCRMFDEGNRKAMGKHHTIYFPAPEAMDAIIQAAIEKAKKQWIANLSGEPADAREPIVPMPAHASEGHTITEIHEKIQSGMEAARHTLEYQQEGIELAAHASDYLDEPIGPKAVICYRNPK